MCLTCHMWHSSHAIKCSHCQLACVWLPCCPILTVRCAARWRDVHAVILTAASRVVALHHTVTCVTTTSKHDHVGYCSSQRWGQPQLRPVISLGERSSLTSGSPLKLPEVLGEDGKSNLQTISTAWVLGAATWVPACCVRRTAVRFPSARHSCSALRDKHRWRSLGQSS